MEELELYVPELEELWFYQKMMSDPETMSYNAGWDMDCDGYHRETGCIDYPDDVLVEWHKEWVGREPNRFYAYVQRSWDGAWIGDVNFHYNPQKKWWDMGILIYAPYRGRGYAVPALKLMLDHAFLDCDVSVIHNAFEADREVARKTHLKAGFKEWPEKDGFLHMMITKKEYEEITPTVNNIIANAYARSSSGSTSTSDDGPKVQDKDLPEPSFKPEWEPEL